MKKILLPAMLFAAFALVSCGGGDTDAAGDSANKDSAADAPKEASFTEVCKDASKMSVTIKGYKYQMSGDFEYATDFTVKQSSLTWNNDSSAVLVLKNYKAEELVGDRKDDQIDITVELTSRHGKKIGPGTYAHSEYDADLSSSTTMMTSKGKVWFNWVAGMDKQGTVTLNYINGDEACGSFALSVEKPDSDQIGTVRISGTFRTGE